MQATFVCLVEGGMMQTTTISAAGTYTVTVTTATVVRYGYNAPVTSLPAPTTTITGPTSFCTGSAAILSAGAGFTAYSWSNGFTTQSITVTNSGAYTVTVTGANGCTGTASHIVSTTLAYGNGNQQRTDLRRADSHYLRFGWGELCMDRSRRYFNTANHHLDQYHH